MRDRGAFTLTARAENHIRGNADLADTILRLQSFEEAYGSRQALITRMARESRRWECARIKR